MQEGEHVRIQDEHHPASASERSNSALFLRMNSSRYGSPFSAPKCVSQKFFLARADSVPPNQISTAVLRNRHSDPIRRAGISCDSANCATSASGTRRNAAVSASVKTSPPTATTELFLPFRLLDFFFVFRAGFFLVVIIVRLPS